MMTASGRCGRCVHLFHLNTEMSRRDKWKYTYCSFTCITAPCTILHYTILYTKQYPHLSASPYFLGTHSPPAPTRMSQSRSRHPLTHVHKPRTRRRTHQATREQHQCKAPHGRSTRSACGIGLCRSMENISKESRLFDCGICLFVSGARKRTLGEATTLGMSLLYPSP